MKLRLLFTILLVWLIGISIPRLHAQNLTLKFTDGTEKSSALSLLGKITFSGSNLVLNYADGTTDLFSESLI